MEIFDLVYWDHSNNPALFVNLAIAVGLFTSLRIFSGAIANINPTTELIKKDNPAFGISLAGVAFAITIVLTGAIYGDPIYNPQDSVISVGLYGIMGLILMSFTRVIFDKISFPGISIRNEIVEGNIAAGIIDAGNVIASAIVIRAVMVWVDANSLEGLQAVLIAYIISQIILKALAVIQIRMFSYSMKGRSLQQAFKERNSALALCFAGKRIGAAFAITAASNIMVYEVYDMNALSEMKLLLLVWTIASIIMIAIVSALSFLAHKVIFFKMDINDEVVLQKNTAIGIIQCVVYISIALLVAELMA